MVSFNYGLKNSLNYSSEILHIPSYYRYISIDKTFSSRLSPNWMIYNGERDFGVINYRTVTETSLSVS